MGAVHRPARCLPVAAALLLAACSESSGDAGAGASHAAARRGRRRGDAAEAAAHAGAAAVHRQRRFRVQLGERLPGRDRAGRARQGLLGPRVLGDLDSSTTRGTGTGTIRSRGSPTCTCTARGDRLRRARGDAERWFDASRTTPAGYASKFAKKSEVGHARPLRVTLDRGDIGVDITATTHAPTIATRTRPRRDGPRDVDLDHHLEGGT